MSKKCRVLVISPKCSKPSAKYLADLLGGDYLLVDGGIRDYPDHDFIINYGSSVPIPHAERVVNKPEAVAICVNKISTLKRVAHGIEWTKSRDMALQWLREDGAVVSRATECGSKSSGVTICETEATFAEAPAKFWTRYFWHDHEVRINVFKGKILSVYEKVLMEEDDGLFFEFKPLKIVGDSPQVAEMMDSISKKIGIDLYGMDVLVNSEGECRLLEVNSGAALHEGTETPLVREIKKEISSHV